VNQTVIYLRLSPSEEADKPMSPFIGCVFEQAASTSFEATGWRVRCGAEGALGGGAASLVGRNV
jgi:hypothetical protein